MKLILAVILTFSSTLAFDSSDEFINEINSKQSLWKAGRNFHKDTPDSLFRDLLGARKLPDNVRSKIPVIRHDKNVFADEIPEIFDARTQWPKCKLVKQIADQSGCGSCWAVSSASAIQDRICIHSDGKFQPEISAKNLMSCNPNTRGCHGGWPIKAFSYWNTDGIVTGGQYGSEIGCQPYPFAQCEHDIDGPKPACPSQYYNTPKCVKTCDNSSINYQKDLYYGEKSYLLPEDERQIRQEILKNGPVVSVFSVYDDFVHYKSGIYVHTNSEPIEGLHAVRIIGWGIENGTKYWLIANSWNEDWGDNGLFKILRGKNECGIEDTISAGIPKLY